MIEWARDDKRVEAVVSWPDWVAIPVKERPFNTTMVRAVDELDAMLRAERGEEWFGGKDYGANR